MVYSPFCACAEFVYFRGPRCEKSFSPQSYSRSMRALFISHYKMSDTARSDPKPSSSNPSSSGTNIEKKAGRKDYYARRDASRVYLFENFAPWREFKKKHGLKTDADVAEMLLENFDATKSSRALW